MNILYATKELLEYPLLFLKKISQETYCKNTPLLLNASIGQHTRHFIELYQCLLWRLDKTKVNYDNRARDYLLETNITVAQNTIRTIQVKLFQININESIRLESSLSDSKTITSSIERELIYNYEHCLHHLAIIRIGLKVLQPNLLLPEHFGIAPSTLTYKKQVQMGHHIKLKK